MHRIGYDAKRIFNNFTGLGNYGRTLLRNLTQYHPEEEYFLYTPKTQRKTETNYFLDSPMFRVRTPGKGGGFLWRSWRMTNDIKQDQVDLFHGLSHEIPYGIGRLGIPSIVTIHDLIFKHYPKQYEWFDRQMYDRKFRYACENSDMIIAISESTKRDIINFYGIEESKIRVIYQSCHEGFMLAQKPAAKAAVRDKYQLPEDYMLYVGSLIERKNLLGIIEAMALLSTDLQLPLVVVGRGDAYKKKVIEKAKVYGLADRLLFIRPEFSELPALYQQASLFLYPSYFEGFGIPVLEALFSETPVLTSSLSSLPEAAGSDACLVDPANAEEMARGIEVLLTDDKLRDQQIRRGYAHAQQFRGEVLTEQLVDAYKYLLD